MSDVATNGPVGRRRHVLEKTCDESVGHEHNYDHSTIVACGGIKVTIRDTADGPIVSDRDYLPGSDPVFIAAKKHHTIKNISPQPTHDQLDLLEQIIALVRTVPEMADSGEKLLRHFRDRAYPVEAVYFCLFSHRDFGGMVSQEYMGNQAAYH